jgi:RNA polymerase sigma-32 factor
MMNVTQTENQISSPEVVNRLLTKQKEMDLMDNIQMRKCPRSLSLIVEAHLGFINNVAKKFKGYEMEHKDLVQEGTIGLLKAIERFDLSLDLRLNTFAVFHIRSEIMNFIIKNYRLSKIATTNEQRKAFFNLRSKKSHAEHLSLTEAIELAEKLNIQNPKVLLDMDIRLKRPDSSLSVSKDQENGLPLENQLLDEFSNVESNAIKLNLSQYYSAQLQSSLSALNEKEKYVIEHRWFVETKNTLAQIAALLGVSIEGVRKIELRAISKMKACVSAH